jgi:restriction system protein
MKYLDRYPAYVGWRRGSRSDEVAAISTSTANQEIQSATPEELIESNYQALTRALEGELLERVRTVDASDFESIIIDLLIAMGYGGGKSEMGRAIGRSGDGGIDGIIREDPLGLDIVYVQAKRYAEGNTIGRPEIQGFAGSLDGVGATKGLFFTTSSFTSGATEYVARISKRIILVDGAELARLMVVYGVGVRPSTSYVIKRIDEDYFAE